MKLLDMPRLSVTTSLTLLIVLAPLMITRPAAADPLGNITTYTASRGDAYYQNTTTGSDGNIWYTSRTDRKIYKVTTTGVVTAYSIPSGYSGPDTLVNGLDGSVWLSLHRTGINTYYNTYTVAKITSSGVFTFYDLPIPQDSATSYAEVTSITLVNGKVWVSRGYSKYVQILTPNGNTATVTAHKIPKPAGVSSTTYNSSQRLYMAENVVYNPVDNNVYIFTREREPGDGTLTYYLEKYSPNGTSSIQDLGYGRPGSQALVFPTVDAQGKVWFVSKSSSSGSKYKVGYYNPTNNDTQLLSTSRGNDRIMSITLGLDGNIWATVKDPNNSSYGRLARIDTANFAVTEFSLPSGNNPYAVVAGVDGNLWITSESYNIRKFGLGSISFADNDNDGLTAEKELKQGTSDSNKDTDNDGLSDYVESQWNTTRDDIFCHPTTNYCEYPDPLQQDIYIETDWMQRPGGSGFSTKPSTTQVDLVKTAFANKGIKAHFDTGQLGGGDELPYEDSIYYLPESGEKDLYDYRDGEEGESQNFAINRKDIYHYMISADEIAYNASGVSNTAADESIVAYGYVKDHPEAYEGTFDTAIAGTIIHELGHGLCLSDTAASYYGQNTACVFDGVDNGAAGVSLPYPFYVSSMNYSYQFELVDYSDGSNISAHPTGDHNDWAGIGITDYTKVDILDILSNESQSRQSITLNKDKTEKLHIALNAEQATKIKQARKKAGIKIQQKTNGKFEVTQTQKGITKRLN